VCPHTCLAAADGPDVGSRGGDSQDERPGERKEHHVTVTPGKHDSLAALLGVQRSAIVRLLADAPSTCGLLAQSLFLVPGGVTHHLQALEAAGLIRRTRDGRHVLVELTARGRALHSLYQRTPRTEW
jgi:DNA-binding transcriptional ArsR family regulator